MPDIPELERHCGSWIIIERGTGLVLCETFERAWLDSVDQSLFEILTTAAYLGRLNARIKANA